MSSFLKLARPYALAAFDYARAKNQLASWKALLESASQIAMHPIVFKLLSNPQISSKQFFNLFCDILSPLLDVEKKNFFLLLAQNERFALLPQIAEMFSNYYAALEKISHVRIVTAVELEENDRKKFAEALTKRIQHQVTLQCETDFSLLGGAVIHMGDRVIDGSVRGKLTRLLENLTG